MYKHLKPTELARKEVYYPNAPVVCPRTATVMKQPARVLLLLYKWLATVELCSQAKYLLYAHEHFGDFIRWVRAAAFFSP